MTACLNGESEDLFCFFDGPLDVLVACTDKRDALRKECWLEGKRNRQGNKGNKERC